MESEFGTEDILFGVRMGVVHRDVLSGRPVTFDERMKLRQILDQSNQTQEGR